MKLPTDMVDPLQCTFEDARRRTLLAGMALDTSAKVAFFEEMVSLAHQFDARDRLAGQDPEVLIAFKLQGYVNDPRRLRDVDDIRELLRTNRESLDLQRVRRYFVLFDREAMLDDILAELGI